MTEIPAKVVAELTLGNVIMQVFKLNPGASYKSFIIRAAPDLLMDIVGLEKYRKLMADGNRVTIFGVHIVSDIEMDYGTCSYCWRH